MLSTGFPWRGTETSATSTSSYHRSSRRPGFSFGGTTLVLAGDPSQLAPVPREPLFKQPTDQTKDTNMNGYRLYRKFCKQGTICLSQVMRSKNLAYVKLQENIRSGNWIKWTVDTMNSRYSAPLAPLDSADSAADAPPNPEAEYCQTPVVKNTTRQALYEAHMDSVSNDLHERGENRPVVLMAEVSSPQRTAAVQTAVNLDLQRNAKCTCVLCCTWLPCQMTVRKAACFSGFLAVYHAPGGPVTVGAHD